MSRRISAVLCLVAVVVAIALVSVRRSQAESAMVAVQASGTTFSPATITVQVGDFVLWMFDDAPHTVTAEDGSFAVVGDQASTSTAVRMKTAGSFPYYCQYHGGPGGAGMSGTVQVMAAPAVPSTTTTTYPPPFPSTTSTTRVMPPTTATTAPPAPPVRTGRPGPLAGDANGVSIVSSWEWDPYRGNSRYVAGEIVNNGPRSVTVNDIAFDMLDAGGRLLATVSTDPRGFVLEPGGRTGFEQDLAPPPGYASLVARVSSEPASVYTDHAYTASITNRYTDQYGVEHIVGQVRNGTATTADDVWVYATFFDGEGRPAGSDHHILDGVPPGQTAGFEFRRSADRPPYTTVHVSAESVTWSTFFAGPQLTHPAPQPAPQAPAAPPAAAGRNGRFGYWMVSASGRVFAFGDAAHLGDAQGVLGNASAVDIEPSSSGDGYWIVDSIGRVFSFGDAPSLAQLPSAVLAAGEQVTSLSATRSGGGYWLFTSRGRVLPFGDAPFFGDVSRERLNGPVLDSVVTPSGRGYYMVASDGGIFSFGDAAFYGSMGGKKLNAPVESLVPDADGQGYWLVASDGGIFAFNAQFQGSMGHTRLNRPISGMVRAGSGYLMVAEDGGIFDFSGSAGAFKGSLGGNPPARPIRAVAVLEGR